MKSQERTSPPPPVNFSRNVLCTGCGALINDRFLLQVNGLSFHSKCLVCVSCRVLLDNETLCYFRNSNVYCKTDYYRLFGTKCSKCSRSINPTDWVRRARTMVFHLACFACDACKRQLSTGEEFALADDKVLCKSHFQELFDLPNDTHHSSNEESCDGTESSSDATSSSRSKSKTKRVRTTFTDEQLQVLQANFQIDSNPDGQDLERIAQITGLSKRVTQVWFQNSRARQKKHLQKQKRKGCKEHTSMHINTYNT
ncbi:LIM/homeobox protein Awh [Orchesella cincta]|uniref:LIM/homeobox protein Awh n=1 Tax=Orchesella cincta TaxID=48709 RepID=A0A1D2NHR2_ORCCI|nr:LIM/homeobox protein Awh [Orchesella cincta]